MTVSILIFKKCIYHYSKGKFSAAIILWFRYYSFSILSIILNSKKIIEKLNSENRWNRIGKKKKTETIIALNT